MPINNNRIDRLATKQSGAALIVFMVLFTLFISSVLLTGLGRDSQQLRREKMTIDALSKAKESLINYALISGEKSGFEGAGYLPCPDSIGDGVGDYCGDQDKNVEGWLPWQTLGGEPLKDGNQVCLRYVVSGNYKITPLPSSAPAAPAGDGFDIQNEMNINMVTDALAIVFAPGKEVSGQSRQLTSGSRTVCGSDDSNSNNNDAVNYLDTTNGVNNAINLSVFILANKNETFNDQLIWITPNDFN